MTQRALNPAEQKCFQQMQELHWITRADVAKKLFDRATDAVAPETTFAALRNLEAWGFVESCEIHMSDRQLQKAYRLRPVDIPQFKSSRKPVAS